MLSTELTKLSSWHARPGILKGTYSKLLCPIIDKGKTVTGTMPGTTMESRETANPKGDSGKRVQVPNTQRGGSRKRAKHG